MAIYQHQDVVDTPAGRTAAVTRSHRFSPGQLLGGAVGIVLGLIGIVAITRTGIDSHLNTPPTHIFGMAQSALTGLVELGAGLLLVLSAADISFRGLMGFIGALLIVAGVIVAAGSLNMLLRLGTEHATGWFVAVMGAIAVLAAAMPSFLRTDRTVTSDMR